MAVNSFQPEQYHTNSAFGEILAQYGVSGQNHILQYHNINTPTGEPLGRLDADTETRYYYLKDHLGSIRVTIDDDGDIVGYDDYFPFGMQMSGRSNNAGHTDDDMKFTGHFLESEGSLGIYHAGARLYDPEVPRFYGVDAMRWDYPGISSYVYAANNPLIFIDPDGNEIDVSELYRKEDGEYVHAAQVEAFEAFFNTEGGFAEIERYAKAGQTVAGHTFESDGDLHKEKVDVNFQGATGLTDDIRGGQTDAQVKDGRLQLTISTRSQSVDSGVITLAHETLIHGRQNAADFMHNGELNSSHLYGELRGWAVNNNYSFTQQRHRGMLHHYQEINQNKFMSTVGSQIVRQHYANTGRSISDDNLKSKMKFSY